MAQFASDTFTGTEGTELATYSGSWSKSTGLTGDAEITSSGTKLRQSSTTSAAYLHSGTPAAADYTVSAITRRNQSPARDRAAGVIGRASTSAQTHYRATISTGVASPNGTLQLFRFVAGAATQLGSNTTVSFVLDTDTEILLRMEGSVIEIYWDGSGTPSISQTDGSPITAAGKAGVRFYASETPTDTACIFLDDFSADDIGGGAYTLTADAGGYTITGQSADLKRGRKLTADAGTYAVTGGDATLKLGRVLSADAGSYSVSGQAATLLFNRKLTADAGSYAITGLDATLTYTPAGAYSLTVDAGNYTLTGYEGTLKLGRVLQADAGSYAITGGDATLNYTSGPTYTLTADAGAYSISGQAATFRRGYVMGAGLGTYAINGLSASLVYSGAPTAFKPLPSWYYQPGNIPLDAPQWLQRELLSVSRATYGAAPVVQFQPQYAEPAKPRDGMTVYFDATGWDPGSGTGVYTRISGAWVKLG